MESFFDLILSNLFLIIVIISGILGLFNKNKEDEKKRTNNRTNKPRPVSTPPRPVKELERPFTRNEKTKPVVMKSVGEQQIEQMERLRKKLNTGNMDTMDDIIENDLSNDLTIERPILQSQMKNPHGKLNHQMGLKLNQKSILQGIMMSEILGPPRSRKPYRSIIEERKIK